jgi:hypothetical protein
MITSSKCQNSISSTIPAFSATFSPMIIPLKDPATKSRFISTQFRKSTLRDCWQLCIQCKLLISMGRYCEELNGSLTDGGSCGPATLGRSEWESTLKLSTLWELGDLRALAIQNLSKIEMREVDQITLGKEYRVAGWLVKGYTKLAKRDNTSAKPPFPAMLWHYLPKCWHLSGRYKVL